MTYTITIDYFGVEVDEARIAAPICRLFAPKSSYVDLPVMQEGHPLNAEMQDGDTKDFGKSVYATNVDGWGRLANLSPTRLLLFRSRCLWPSSRWPWWAATMRTGSATPSPSLQMTTRRPSTISRWEKPPRSKASWSLFRAALKRMPAQVQAPAANLPTTGRGEV